MPATGLPEVDAILTAVEAVTDLPTAEHAAVFEEAHAGLRRTLDDPPADD